jgi:hypothetical protein
MLGILGQTFLERMSEMSLHDFPKTSAGEWTLTAILSAAVAFAFMLPWTLILWLYHAIFHSLGWPCPF